MPLRMVEISVRSLGGRTGSARPNTLTAKGLSESLASLFERLLPRVVLHPGRQAPGGLRIEIVSNLEKLLPGHGEV